MDKCTDFNKSILIPNPITQVAALPYELYVSLEGKYFVGYTTELTFGKGKSSWAGLFNPTHSGVNLYVYIWQVANTGVSPIRTQIWFNSNPPGCPTRVTTITNSNTAIYPTPYPKIKLLQAVNVIEDPENGVKAFVRRAQAGITVGDVEDGKFIFPPGGSFMIFLSNPETPDQTASATVNFAWFEEKIDC